MNEQCPLSIKFTRRNKHPGTCNKNKIWCTVKQKCSQHNGHIGSCAEINYWIKSPIIQTKKFISEDVLTTKKIRLEESNLEAERGLKTTQV